MPNSGFAIPTICTRTVVFLLSSDYSGSTWLGYVLGSSSKSAFVGEFYRIWKPEIQQECSWCAAQGQATCEVLGGLESCQEINALESAFSRLSVPFLIDSSKKESWARQFVSKKCPYDIRLVHVIRDPRGWYASVKRRRPGSVDGLVADWCAENACIRAFLESSNVPSTAVFYDELAESPEPEFERLCDFLGFRFEPASLRYWEKPHHALAANGASYPLLSSAPNAAHLKYFITADDPFYRARCQKLFRDTRWKIQLNASEIASISSHSGVVALLGHYSRSLSWDGIQR